MAKLPKIAVRDGCTITGKGTELSFPCLYQSCGGEWKRFDTVKQLADELESQATAAGFRDRAELELYIADIFVRPPKKGRKSKKLHSQALYDGFNWV